MGKRLACWLVVGLLLGVAGCPPWTFSFDAWGLQNRRSHTLSATVRVFEGFCDEQELSEADAYGEPVSRLLLAGDVVSLQTLRGLEGDKFGGGPGDCGAVWLVLPGLYEGVLAWDHSPRWDVEADPYAHSVVVEGPRDEVALHLPVGMRELPAPR